MKIAILFFLSIINLIFWFDNNLRIDNASFMLPLLSILATTIMLRPKIRNGKIEIKIIYFILAGILYFNTPLYFDSFFNRNELMQLLIKLGISEIIFIKTNLLLGISLPLICVGYFLSFKKEIRDKNCSVQFKKKKINILPFVFFSFIFLMLSFNITGLSVGSTFRGASSYYYILLSRAILLASVILVYNLLNSSVDGHYKNKLSTIINNNFSYFIILFLFLFYVLIGGDRGPALTVISILLFGYILINGMKLTFKNFIHGTLLLFLISSVFSFVEILRVFETEKFDLNTFNSALSSYENYENMLGVQIRCTSYAIEGIENGLYPHTYGFFFLQSIVRGIPFFGNLILDNIFIQNSILADGSAHLISIQHNGIGYTSGLGTTYLADTYIEFGLIGIIFISLLYGAIIGVFENKCRNLSFKGFSDFLLIFIFMGFAFYTGRATLWSFLVNFIHAWIIFYFIRFIFSNFLKK